VLPRRATAARRRHRAPPRAHFRQKFALFARGGRAAGGCVYIKVCAPSLPAAAAPPLGRAP